MKRKLLSVLLVLVLVLSFSLVTAVTAAAIGATLEVEARDLPSITLDGAVTPEEWGVADFAIASSDTYHLGVPGNAGGDVSYDVYIESDDSNLYFAFKATDAPDWGAWEAWATTHYGGEIFYTNFYIDADNNDVLDGDDHAISSTLLFEAADGNWANPVDLEGTPVEWTRSWENRVTEYKIPMSLLGINPGDTIAFATQAFGYGWYPEGSEWTPEEPHEHPEVYVEFTLQPFATIQAAIDSATEGDTILIYTGTYVENLIFDGDEADDLTITSSTGVADDVTINGYVHFDNGSTSGLTFDSLKFYARAFDQALFRMSEHVNAITQDRLAVKNCHIVRDPTPGEGYNQPASMVFNAYGIAIGDDFEFVGNKVEGFQDANWAVLYFQVYEDDLSDPVNTGWKINNNVFKKCGGVAIAAYDQDGIEVKGNTVDYTGTTMHIYTWAGIDVERARDVASPSPIVIEGNTVIGPGKDWTNDWGEFEGIVIWYADNSQITGNPVSNCYLGIGVLGDDPATAPENATISGNILSENTVSVLNMANEYAKVDDGGKIQAAIGMCLAGYTVNVAAGTYNETVVIPTEDLTLEGAQPGVDPTEEGARIVLAEESTVTGAVTIKASDIAVDGFRIEGTVYVDDSVSDITDATISNNIITGTSYGIMVGTASNKVISQLIIEYNEIIDNASKGICFWKVDWQAGNLHDVTIRDNTISGSGSSGISTYGAGPYFVVDNTVTGNQGNGISLKYDDGDIVTGNIVTGNDAMGINMHEVTNCVVEDNTVSGHTSADVITTFWGTPEPVGKGSGIYLHEDSTGNTIRFNDLTGNRNGILINNEEAGDPPSANSINYNNVTGNIDYGVLNATPSLVDATKNWWDSASGPEHATLNPGAQGDAVSENVDFSPWLYQLQEDIVPTEEPAYAQSVVLDNYGDFAWNTFSTPIYLDGSADTWAKLITLTGLDYSIAYRFDPASDPPFVPLTTTDESPITPGEGLFIKMNTAGSLPILYSTADNLAPPSRTLTVGFNLIGLAWLEDMDVDDALFSLAGEVQVVSPTGNESPGPVLTGDTVYVGEAYWAYMLGEETLVGFTTTPVNWAP